MKRSRKRVAEIDSYIKQHYPTVGPDEVAKVLNEKRSYIMSRAHYLKVCMHTKKSHKKVKVRSQKEIISELRNHNFILRNEVIKLTCKNRKLRQLNGIEN